MPINEKKIRWFALQHLFRSFIINDLLFNKKTKKYLVVTIICGMKGWSGSHNIKLLVQYYLAWFSLIRKSYWVFVPTGKQSHIIVIAYIMKFITMNSYAYSICYGFEFFMSMGSGSFSRISVRMQIFCILFRTARREVRIVRWTLSDISHDHAQNSLIWFPCHIKERENTHD